MLFAAVISTMTQSSLGKERFIWLTVPGLQSVKGNQGRNSGQEQKQAMEECCSPACSPGSQSGTFLVSVRSTVHSELGPAVSTIHQENAPVDLPAGNVTVEVSSSEERVLYSSSQLDDSPCWKRRVLAQEREWMVTRHLQSGSRKRRLLRFSSLPPFYSVPGPRLRDGVTHIQGGSSF